LVGGFDHHRPAATGVPVSVEVVMCKALRIFSWGVIAFSILWFTPVVMRAFLAPTSPSQAQRDKVSREMNYHGAKEMTCDYDMTKCWFERNGKRIKVKL
jgi:hypothetical protein